MAWSRDWAGLRVNDRAGFKDSHLLANGRRAGVAQLVESQLPKLVVASSNLVARSID